MNTVQQAPKLGFFAVAFICILTIGAIIAPHVIVNTFKQDIVDYKKAIADKLPQPPKTYTASNFTVFGKAVNDGNWVGNIDRNSGFRFAVNSEKQATAKIAIKYKSENMGAILKVNGNAQNLYFPTTKGNWSGAQGYNQQPHKTVIVKLRQGDNKIELSSGWLTDFAPDIAEITVTADNDIQKPFMAGVWKGSYSNGKGRTTLTINDDETGVSEFVWQGTKGSHSVRVNYQNGTYSVSGVDWIDEPQRGWWSFYNWQGTIINGKFSGNGFNLERSGIAVLLPISQSWRYSFNPPTGNWYENSFTDNQWQVGKAPFGLEQNRENTRWTTSQIFIRTKFNISDVSSIGYAYLNIWHDEDVQIYLNGQLALNLNGNNANYEAFQFDKALLKSGENIIAAKCTQSTGGQLIDVGIFVNTEKYIASSYETPTIVDNEDSNSSNSRTSNEEIKRSATTDYSVQVEAALSNAINAFDDGRFLDAFNYYTEAANYPTDRSSSIKQNAARKFKEKAERLISNNNGECDDLSKQLLQYANSLYSTSEIQRLLNKCGSTSGVVSSGSGRFPQGSQRLLSYSDISGLTKYDLKIMRNEIFARHGYIFTTTDLKNYFQNQSWYTPRYSNVTTMLTNIEQQNIALIKRYE